MAKKQTSGKVSSVAGKALSGKKSPTAREVKSIAGSALSQDERKGQKPKKKK